MNTKESNKLIAEFMGMELYAPNDYDVRGCRAMMGVKLKGDKHFYRAEKMLFHKDWNWLMAVVQEIELRRNTCKNMMGVATLFGGGRTVIQCYKNEQLIYTIDEGDLYGIAATYSAVINYIKWYNENI
jgi:hypothetical protein